MNQSLPFSQKTYARWLELLRSDDAPPQITGKLHERRKGGEDCYCALGLLAVASGFSVEEHSFLIYPTLHVLVDYHVDYWSLNHFEDEIGRWNDLVRLSFPEIADRLVEIYGEPEVSP